jgi:hypothetical protein
MRRFVNFDRTTGWDMTTLARGDNVKKSIPAQKKSENQKLLESILDDSSLSKALDKKNRRDLKHEVSNILDKYPLQNFEVTTIHPWLLAAVNLKMTCLYLLENALFQRDIDIDQLLYFLNNSQAFRLDFVKEVTSNLLGLILFLGNHNNNETNRPEEEAKFWNFLQPLRQLDCIPIPDDVPHKKNGGKNICSTVSCIPVSQKPYVEFENIAPTSQDWVRVCLFQIKYTVEKLPPSKGFGYVLAPSCHDDTFNKLVLGYDIALAEKADIVIVPEFALLPEFLPIFMESNHGIVIPGTFYEKSANICPIIINGKFHRVQKITPAPGMEDGVMAGRAMKRGSKITVFQTSFGKLAVMICIDYSDLGYLVLHHDDPRIAGVDFIINPSFNDSINSTTVSQLRANLDCMSIGKPYIIQVNALQSRKIPYAGTCIIAMENHRAIKRYRIDELVRQKDPIDYKFVDAAGEMLVFATLNIRQKEPSIPAAGLKMKDVCRYIYTDYQWQPIDVQSLSIPKIRSKLVI